MSRHLRLQKRLRSPIRAHKRRRNRLNRQITRLVREHFADGHVHDGPRCPYDPDPGAAA